MNDSKVFGSLSAEKFSVGDIVQWSVWDITTKDWEEHYGIITSIHTVLKSNRLVSMSKVRPLNNNTSEIEFFTLNLKMVSRVNGTN
jgi:hypothetical protein|tara:strand:+ start:819 stop:1076 length:258 start_codon:yes stop_codon:yes gene_type:complete